MCFLFEWKAHPDYPGGNSTEDRDLYLVVDEVRDVASPLASDLIPLGRADRRLLLKYGHTFRW